jgi:hypothetical protein
MQSIEFRPAHLHRDIVRTDGWIRDEIQFDQIAFQNRRTAYRSIDNSPSHRVSAAQSSNAVRSQRDVRAVEWSGKLRFTNHANTNISVRTLHRVTN